MKDYSIFLPSYSIGASAYRHIPEICGSYGSRAVLIGGQRALAAAADRIQAAAVGGGLEISGVLWYGGETAYESVEQLLDDDVLQKSDMIFAVGGGKSLDTGKAAGEKTGKPVFTFPTIASTCAAITALSVMYHPDGRFRQPYFLRTPPRHAFIDTTVLAAAPDRFLWAGLGDTYAKFFESTMSARGEELTHYHRLGVNVSTLCLEPLLEYGVKGLADNRLGRVSYELEQLLLAVIVNTGIASILLTVEHTIDYNTGLAHAIFYVLTAYPQVEARHLHGEVVGFAILVLLLVDGQEAMFLKMAAFNRSVGLPTRIGELDITPEELEEVIPKVALMPDIEHSPYPITEAMLRRAFWRLEHYNQADKLD